MCWLNNCEALYQLPLPSSSSNARHLWVIDSRASWCSISSLWIKVTSNDIMHIWMLVGCMASFPDPGWSGNETTTQYRVCLKWKVLQYTCTCITGYLLISFSLWSISAFAVDNCSRRCCPSFLRSFTSSCELLQGNQASHVWPSS